MGSLSIWHWIVVVVVVLLLFGRGKISELMGDVAQGIKSFKKGMADDEKTADTDQARQHEDHRSQCADGCGQHHDDRKPQGGLTRANDRPRAGKRGGRSILRLTASRS